MENLFRNLKILSARVGGESYKSIGEKYQLSAVQCGNICKTLVGQLWSAAAKHGPKPEVSLKHWSQSSHHGSTRRYHDWVDSLSELDDRFRSLVEGQSILISYDPEVDEAIDVFKYVKRYLKERGFACLRARNNSAGITVGVLKKEHWTQTEEGKVLASSCHRQYAPSARTNVDSASPPL